MPSSKTLALGKEGLLASNLALRFRKNYYEGMVDYITDPNLSDDILAEAAELAGQKGKIPAVDLDRITAITAKALSRSIASAQNEDEF